MYWKIADSSAAFAREPPNRRYPVTTDQYFLDSIEALRTILPEWFEKLTVFTTCKDQKG